MAFARVFDAKGWTPEQYDRLIELMDLGGRSAPGVLYNWSAQTAEGMRVVDVYADRESADHLAQEKIGPIIQQLGLPMPQISEFDVHAILQP